MKNKIAPVREKKKNLYLVCRPGETIIQVPGKREVQKIGLAFNEPEKLEAQLKQIFGNEKFHNITVNADKIAEKEPVNEKAVEAWKIISSLLEAEGTVHHAFKQKSPLIDFKRTVSKDWRNWKHTKYDGLEIGRIARQAGLTAKKSQLSPNGEKKDFISFSKELEEAERIKPDGIWRKILKIFRV